MQRPRGVKALERERTTLGKPNSARGNAVCAKGVDALLSGNARRRTILSGQNPADNADAITLATVPADIPHGNAVSLHLLAAGHALLDCAWRSMRWACACWTRSMRLGWTRCMRSARCACTFAKRWCDPESSGPLGALGLHGRTLLARRGDPLRTLRASGLGLHAGRTNPAFEHVPHAAERHGHRACGSRGGDRHGGDTRGQIKLVIEISPFQRLQRLTNCAVPTAYGWNRRPSALG